VGNDLTLHDLFEKLFGPLPSLPAPSALDSDRRAAWALWTAAVCLVLLVFKAGIDMAALNPALAADGSRTLASRANWLVAGGAYYLLIPLIVILAVFRESPARYGLRVHFTQRSFALYALALLIILPAVYLVSETKAFTHQYPMVRNLGDNLWLLVLWESLRALRFVALEFFFRGFLLFSLEERFGYHAIAVAALPYGLIHYAKPFPEAIGAIVAGAVLGLFALRTRSIAGGALIHIIVATSMDMLALWHMGSFD
jgi:membrane protease YdiL (CAAX protease family)